MQYCVVSQLFSLDYHQVYQLI